MVLRIFTENSISPGPCRRQRGSRYTIRAGRYLCDKEFRYLRTVRVTAAVYRGFHSKLITLLLPTFQHRAGVRLYTSCYHLAESCVFNKQSLPPGMCRSPKKKIGEHPFSRSYGVILPSSFDMVLSSALVYSTCSPVSVWGTVSSPGGSPPPILSFFLEVSTLLTMTTVATINRLATMAGRYALLSRDPYSNQIKALLKIQRATGPGRVRKALMTQGSY